MPSLLTASEWDELILPGGINTAQTREKILRAGETRIGSAFRLHRRRIFARDLVGFVDAGSVQIQIVPKIYSEHAFGSDPSALLRLLASAGISFPSAFLAAGTSADSSPFLQPLLAHFAAEISAALAQGVPRRYSLKEEFSPTVRGRIDLTRIACRRPGQEHLVPIRYSPLQTDNELSRLLRAVAEMLLRHTTSVKARKSLDHSLQMLTDVKRVRISAGSIRHLNLNRLETRWHWLVDLAWILLSGSSPNPFDTGRSTLFSLLFPLDSIFENALRRALRRGLKGGAVRINPKSPKLPALLHPPSGETFCTMKPDLVFTDPRTGTHVAIGDAKWKRLIPGTGSLGLTPADIYQVRSYMTRFGAGRSILFFPSKDRLPGMTKTTELHFLPDRTPLVMCEIDVGKMLEPKAEQRRKNEDTLGDEVKALLAI